VSTEIEPGSDHAPGEATPPEVNLSRRRLVTPRRALIGGIPVMMTLASKSALAWPDCTYSRVMSGNMSLAHQIAPTESCAMSPGCWVSLKNWNGLKGLFTPSSQFSSVFGLSHNNWSCTSGATLLQALQGKCTIYYTPPGKSKFAVSYTAGGYGLAAQCAAAVLNAAAFSPSGHFLVNGINRDVSWVLSQVAGCWNTTPNPKTQTGCNSVVSGMCNTFSSSIQGAECDTSL